MKEIKQQHVTWITLLNTFVIICIVAFFWRKLTELLKREEDRDKRIEKLDNSIKENDKHHKAVLSRLNKKLTDGMTTIQPPRHMVPPSIETEIETEGRDDIADALDDLLA